MMGVRGWGSPEVPLRWWHGVKALVQRSSQQAGPRSSLRRTACTVHAQSNKRISTLLCVFACTRGREGRGRGLILIISCQALGLALQTRWRKSKCVSGSCTCKCVCVCVAALPLKGTRRGSVPDSVACGISGSATRALKKQTKRLAHKHTPGWKSETFYRQYLHTFSVLLQHTLLFDSHACIMMHNSLLSWLWTTLVPSLSLPSCHTESATITQVNPAS